MVSYLLGSSTSVFLNVSHRSVTHWTENMYCTLSIETFSLQISQLYITHDFWCFFSPIMTFFINYLLPENIASTFILCLLFLLLLYSQRKENFIYFFLMKFLLYSRSNIQIFVTKGYFEHKTKLRSMAVWEP